MWFRFVLLTIITVAMGATVATGIYAFIAKLGIVTRLMTRTNTAKYTFLIENCIVLGGIAGTFYSLLQLSIPVTIVGLTIIGLFWGLFVGCFAMAIAETVNVIPYFIRKLKINMGISILIIVIALTKGVASFWQLYCKYQT